MLYTGLVCVRRQCISCSEHILVFTTKQSMELSLSWNAVGIPKLLIPNLSMYIHT